MDDYFGKTESRMYSVLIQSKLGGKVISKRRDRAYAPDGLIYAVNSLGLHYTVLLRALEGMCVERKTEEVSDSEYLVYSVR